MDVIALCKELNEGLTRTLVDPVASLQDVTSLDALSRQCVGEPSEGYALALAISRLHEARDSSQQLDALNGRLLAWCAGSSDPHAVPVGLVQRGEAWSIVLAEGLALAVLHSDSVSSRCDLLCKALITRLVEAISPETDVQRLRLRGLTTALAYSQLTGNLPIRLDLDTIAKHCIGAMPGGAIEIGCWWAERTLMEIFTYVTEHRAEPPITDLLAFTARELSRRLDAITRFKHIRNQFEWARIEKDLAKARRELEALREAQMVVGSRSRALSIVVLRARASLAIDEADYISAERFTRDAIAVADDIAASSNQRMALWSMLLKVLSAHERAADAAAAAEKAATYALSQHRDILVVLANLLHARAKWTTEYRIAIDHLRRAMQSARGANYSQFLIVNPSLAAWLAARALDLAIEAPFVTEIVLRRKLIPPPDAGPQWPWAVRIRLLGGCAIEGETVNLSEGGKAQQKPLDVIQLLAIAGPRGLDRANLARAVYGSAMLDSPATLNMAISRARRLLGDDSLIDNEGSRIHLDSTRVYVDLWAMEALKPTSDDEASSQCMRLLDLYAGPLLLGSANADKHRMAAATIRDRFVGLVVALAAKVAPDQAIEIFRQAIARERVAEVLYRSLIERLSQQGDAAEAVEVYQQLELALSRAYGVAPSERTQRLIEAVRKNSPSRVDVVTASAIVKSIKPESRQGRNKVNPP